MQNKYSVIGYNFGGGGNIPGTNTAPHVLRAFLKIIERLRKLGIEVEDLGDTTPDDYAALEKEILDNISEQEKGINNIVPTLASCKVLNEKTTLALNKGHIPIILGGDHSLSIGSVSAVSSFYEKQQKKVGLIWIDSHADINIPSTSPSNNLFGMSVASLLDLFTGYATTMQTKRPAVDINNLVYIGLRDLDKGEVEFIKDLKINAFTIKDIDILGMAEVTKRAIQIATDNTCGYVLSFDLDVCDPSIVPGTQTPVRGGITFREAHLLMELIADNKKMLSLEMVELNPLLDRDFITAELAVSLIESGLGKKIL